MQKRIAIKISKSLSPSGAGVIFGLATLCLNALAHHFPAFIETWYSRGLFQFIRYAIDNTTGRLPFPAFYLFWAGVAVYWLLVFRRRPKHEAFRQKLLFWGYRLFGFAGLIFGLFFWMWGFNYARIPLEKQIGLQVIPLDSVALWQELYLETRALDSLRQVLQGNDTTALNDQRFWPVHAENTVRAAVENWLDIEHFPVGGRVRGRFIYPEGTLFKFGASGIYWPFVGEGNLEGGMHPLAKLPAMAHEMSHGYGFSDEGICNFIAYVALYKHPNAYIAYCCHLDYWSTVAEACWFNNTDRYKKQYESTIPAGVLADERAIRKQHSKFRELAPELRYQVYDSYLKAQGIASGMLNYDEVLMLVRAWRSKQADH